MGFQKSQTQLNKQQQQQQNKPLPFLLPTFPHSISRLFSGICSYDPVIFLLAPTVYFLLNIY